MIFFVLNALSGKFRVVQLQKNLEELTPNLSKKDKHDQCDIRLDASPEKDQQTKELTEK